MTNKIRVNLSTRDFWLSLLALFFSYAKGVVVFLMDFLGSHIKTKGENMKLTAKQKKLPMALQKAIMKKKKKKKGKK